MATLTQLLAAHGSLLVLDAASTTTQVGLLRAGRPPLWRSAGPEAGTALFTGVDACLREAGLELAGIGAFVFCAGPGSMLGSRTTAMAIRTWQAIAPRPAYCYQSLPLNAHELLRAGTAMPFNVIADARRDSWHCVTVGAGRSISALQRLPVAEVAALPGELWQPSAFRSWAAAPRATRDCGYDLAALFAAQPDKDLFTSTDAPDAFSHEAPVYKKSPPRIHRADPAARK